MFIVCDHTWSAGRTISQQQQQIGQNQTQRLCCSSAEKHTHSRAPGEPNNFVGCDVERTISNSIATVNIHAVKFLICNNSCSSSFFFVSWVRSIFSTLHSQNEVDHCGGWYKNVTEQIFFALEKHNQIVAFYSTFSLQRFQFFSARPLSLSRFPSSSQCF